MQNLPTHTFLRQKLCWWKMLVCPRSPIFGFIFTLRLFKAVIFFGLWFYWTHGARGCLLHSLPVEEEWHFSTFTKDDSTSRAHKPPGPGVLASCATLCCEQTSVLPQKNLWSPSKDSDCQINGEKGDNYTLIQQACVWIVSFLSSRTWSGRRERSKARFTPELITLERCISG